MKKIIFVLGIFLLASSFVCANHDDRFFTALRTCTPYESMGALDVQGVNADYTSRVIGWSNNKCVYKKTVRVPGMDACIECRFSRENLKKLTSVVNANRNNAGYSFENIDITNISSLENNPVVNLWLRYLQDPTICTVGIE